MSRNRFGVDQSYFDEKLGILQRDLANYTPQELARALARLAKVADSKTLAEPEFNDTVYQCPRCETRMTPTAETFPAIALEGLPSGTGRSS